MLDWLAFTVRRPFYNTYPGYWIYTHLLLNRGGSRFAKIRQLRAGSFRFLLTGYPRSGNTYLTGMVNRVLDFDNFGHHMHTTIGLKLSVRQGMRSYVVFRSPAESVMSLVLLNSNREKRYLRFGWLNVAYSMQKMLCLLYLREYAHYYQYAVSRPRQITLIPSEKVFANTRGVLERIAAENDLNGEAITHDRCVQASEFYRERKRRSRHGVLVSGIPNAEKDLAKQKLLKQIVDHPAMIRANSIFQRMQLLERSDSD